MKQSPVARRSAQLIVALVLAVATPAAAQQQGTPPTVVVAQPLEAQVTDSSEFTGRFEAVEAVTIQAQVTGYLSEIHFVDGQMVTAGDLLFVIDPRPFEAAVASARADLQSARAKAELAKLELGRGEQLVTTGAVSQDTVDSRRANYDVSAADVAAAQARVSSAEVDLAYTRIMAPVSGRISAARVNVGNLVVGGGGSASVLTSIVSIDPIHFVFDASEGDYLAYERAFGTSLMATGQDDPVRVEVRLQDEADYRRQGIVDFVDNSFDAATGTIEIRAVLDNADGMLVPGLFGKLRLQSSKPYAALLIPDRAVLSDQSNKIVMVVDAEGKVSAQTVTLGPLYRGLRVVLTGIEAGQWTIVDGLLMARPGQPVTPQQSTLSFADGN